MTEDRHPETLRMFVGVPWMPRGGIRTRYITRALVQTHGATDGCPACQGDGQGSATVDSPLVPAGGPCRQGYAFHAAYPVPAFSPQAQSSPDGALVPDEPTAWARYTPRTTHPNTPSALCCATSKRKRAVNKHFVHGLRRQGAQARVRCLLHLEF